MCRAKRTFLEDPDLYREQTKTDQKRIRRQVRLRMSEMPGKLDHATVVAYKVGQFPFAANGRALGMGRSDGFIKVLADAKTDEILGVHIIGPNASDLIAEAAVAMEFKAAAEDIARICHPHPSLSEVMREAALATDSRALNM